MIDVGRRRIVLTIAFVVIGTVILASGMLRLRISTSLSDFFPSYPEVEELKKIKKDIGFGSPFVVLVDGRGNPLTYGNPWEEIRKNSAPRISDVPANHLCKLYP